MKRFFSPACLLQSELHNTTHKSRALKDIIYPTTHTHTPCVLIRFSFFTFFILCNILLSFFCKAAFNENVCTLIHLK